MEPQPLRERLWMDDPPAYVTHPEEGPNLFTVEVSHDGFFCGFGAKLEYSNDTISVFDNNPIDTWCKARVDEIISYLCCLRDEKVHVYWQYLGKNLYEGLMPLATEAHCIAMRDAAALEKSIPIFVDHTNFMRIIRDDIIRTRPAFAIEEPALARPAASTAAQGLVARAATSTSAQGSVARAAASTTTQGSVARAAASTATSSSIVVTHSFVQPDS